jgi:hypothetical protein
MGFFDVYDDTAYLNQIFSQNNMAFIDQYINQNGISYIENWKNGQGKDIARQWAAMPDNSETALLRAIGEPSPAMNLKTQWQQELRRQLRTQTLEQRREYSATQNNYGPVYNAPVHYGDNVSGTEINTGGGDYINGDKNITPQPAEKKEIPDKPPTWEIHYMARLWENEYKPLFEVMGKAIEAGLVEYTNDRMFNFKCTAGCVGLFFKEAGYTEYKQISRFILINGVAPAKTTLENAGKNTPPSEWENIKKQFFNNTLV